MRFSFSGLLLLTLLTLPGLAFAQTSVQLNSAEIKFGLQKLDVVASALYVAAHPDDENTRLLTYLAKEKKFRTAYLSLTRGDGGQNLIGNEQSELLGLIRTQELLAARKMDGAEQFFTRAVDFGFSKSTEEALAIWDHDQVLADAVWVIRKFKPDIIITRFPEDSRAGHGQHSASAVIAREAFHAAADPKRFPEQLKYHQVWQAKRLVWNTSNFGGNNLTSADQIKVDIGGFNPLIGKGYGEIAGESRTNHKSQGFGSARQRGQSIEYFRHTAGDEAASDLLEGINSSWEKIDGGLNVSSLIREAAKTFSFEQPSASVPAMVRIHTEIEKISNEHWKIQKSKEIKELIIAASGLWFESYAEKPLYSIGDQVQVRSQIVKQSPGEVTLESVDKQLVKQKLSSGQVLNFTSTIRASEMTHPYWLGEQTTEGMYSTPEVQLTGSPESMPAFSSSFVLNIAGKPISFERPVVFKYTDPVRGEVYEPVAVGPAISAAFSERAYIFTNGTPGSVLLNVKSYAASSKGSVALDLPKGWRSEPLEYTFSDFRPGEERVFSFKVVPPPSGGGGYVNISIKTDGQIFRRAHALINYEHIPKQFLFPIAEARIENINLKTGGRLIGYLPGAGDLIPEALEQIGYQVNILSEAQILNADLSQYDAIITGVRAYNVNDRMSVIQPRLLDYVSAGGVLLVQYNTSSDLKLQDIGPFPFRISRNRVTQENAEVSIIDPSHPILNHPNKITSTDFEGWIQERGLYFTSDADPAYQKILSMHDKGESPNDGALMIADHGKGRFVYTSLSFFRELPAGVPGAYRIFVNLITKNKVK